MALPTSYLTSYKNVDGILKSMQAAQAPERFTVKFLQDLGYTSAADRLIIRVLKTLGFLRESGEPTQLYHEFLDPSQSARILAEQMRSAYADLFQINKNAQNMGTPEVRAKFKTISQGAYSDDVLGKMANTFTAFAKLADFSAAEEMPEQDESGTEDPSGKEEHKRSVPPPPAPHPAGASTRLVYDIHIHLPATRDQAVYDALFSSMTKHLKV